jgi:5-methyltetrahydrofolate--homocysteine methyltransferase
MADLLTMLRSGRVLLMDGAMGTELQRAGIQEGECYELWNLTHPDQVRAIHRSYVFAGAECLVTNTFQANPAALAKHGLEDRLEEINDAAVGIARSVCGVRHVVVASIGPVDCRDEQELEALGRVAHSLRGADALLLETWHGPFATAVQQVLAVAVNPESLPVLLSVAYSSGAKAGDVPGRFLRPHPGTIAEWAAESGIAGLGVNCGKEVDMDDLVEIVGHYRKHTDLPLFARPNAGTPQWGGDSWEYGRSPAQMARKLPALLEAGVSMIGGCCGTTPEHIAAFRPIVAEWNACHGKAG